MKIHSAAKGNDMATHINSRYIKVLILLSILTFAGCSKTDSFFKAIEKENIEQIRSLLKSNPSLASIVRPEIDHDNYATASTTPLMEVVLLANNKVIAELLLSNGADPLWKNSLGRSALMQSIEYNKHELVELYLNHLKSRNININNLRLPIELTKIYNKFRSIGMGSYRDQVPLIHFALKDSDETMIALLLKHGANAKGQSKLGFSALHYFADTKSNSSDKVLNSLLNNIDIESNPPIGPDGVRPLHLAAYNGNFEAFTALINIGQSPYYLTSQMESVLDMMNKKSLDGRRLIKWAKTNQLTKDIIHSNEIVSLTITLASFRTSKDAGDGAVKFLGEIKELRPLFDLQGNSVTVNISKAGRNQLIDKFNKLSTDDQIDLIAFCRVNEINSMLPSLSEAKDSRFWAYISNILITERSILETERRLYELARKNFGNQVTWKIKLENLKTKIDFTFPIKGLRFNIKKITETNHLPEYNIAMENDVVMFTRKEPPRENKAPQKLPKHVSKKE